MPELLHVRTVYGDALVIARADYEGSRTLLPLRLPNGERLEPPPGQAGSLHRENIAAVFPIR